MQPPADQAAAPAPAAVEPPPPGILVQVSALTRREDADSLVALLKEMKLPVLVTSGENDSLFHVVVGPYQNEAEAQKTKQILEQEGFRPFIRR
jgi:cell division septation protein DedD